LPERVTTGDGMTKQTWKIIKARWDNGDIAPEGEALFRFARNDILDLADTIKAQRDEIETLKKLLNRWLETEEITLTATFYPGMIEKYESIINDTNEVLK